MGKVFVAMEGFRDEMSWAKESSFEAVRETRRREKFWRDSCRAYSLPMPSEAPVTRAQDLGGPKVRSCGRGEGLLAVWFEKRKKRELYGLSRDNEEAE